MRGYVYVLLSTKDKRTYVGSTNDLLRRISQHNKGEVFSTKYRRPLKMVYSEEFETIVEARRKEKYFKSCSGRKKLAIILSSVLPPW